MTQVPVVKCVASLCFFDLKSLFLFFEYMLIGLKGNYIKRDVIKIEFFFSYVRVCIS